MFHLHHIESFYGHIGVLIALVVIAALIFAECAVLVGLFLPGGDTLLLVCGVLAAQGTLPLPGVIAVSFIAAVAGYEVGYYIGKKTGPKVFKRDTGKLFRKEYADRAARFYKHHGGKTVVVSRFIGYVRTIAPLLAGIAKMQRRKFIIYNVTGAFLWSLIVVMLGYWLGSAFTKEIKRYSMLLTILGVVLAVLIIIYMSIRARSARSK